MRARFEGFCGPTYEASSRNFNAERCINLYPEFDQRGLSKSDILLYSTPGLGHFITLPSSPLRCLWAGDNRVFVVAGTAYGEIKWTFPAAPTFENRGTIANNGEPAQILSNGTQLLIISAGNAYIDAGGAATGTNAVLIPSLPAAYGTYLDGYFLVVDFTANHIRYSELFNGATWPALNFFARASSRDALTACVAHNGQIWTVGRRYIEAWYNSGNADSPFQPISGSGIAQGVVTPHGIVELDGSLFFPSEDDRGYGGVFRTRGFQLERVSNHAVDARLRLGTTGQAGYAYEEDGHRFWIFTDYGGSQTWAYDTASKMWHERGFWTGSAFTSQLGRCHCATTPGFGGPDIRSHLVGARNSGIVYQQSILNETDGGSPIRRYRQAPHLHNENKNVFHHSLELELNSGTFTSGTPEALLKWSDDDAQTFNADRAVSLGTFGEFNKRVIWRRLGKSRDRIYGATFHDLRGRLAIADAFIDATAGTS